MNAFLTIHELAVLVLGLGVLLLDLWTPPERKRVLGYAAAAGVGVVLIYSLLRFDPAMHSLAFNGGYVLDGLALFFKRFFLLAALMVLILAAEATDRFQAGVSEYYSLVLFALLGMMFAASAHNFAVLFVSVELITITFYVLTSFHRDRLPSLEAGVKYLILGAVSTAITVYGIAMLYGLSGTLDFEALAAASAKLHAHPVFLLGVLLVLAGLAFKIAAFPLQIWAPDIYQGAPAPTTAFLAVGSKAAGFVLLLRVLFTAVPAVTAEWTRLLMIMAGATILYGNLCAIPQRSLKRLLGYSSIAHAGYLLLGVAVMAANLSEQAEASTAILYYLAGYLFTVLGAFGVLCLVLSRSEDDDIGTLAGLPQRSPMLAAAMALAMVSLAGIPPLAGFFGKFLLLKAAVSQAATHPGFYLLVAIAVIGILISIYYYFGVVRTIYWSEVPGDISPIKISPAAATLLGVCMLGMLYLGTFPNALVNAATQVVAVLNVQL